MSPATFEYHGRWFEQFDHEYNATLTNERAVEIPIARAFVAGESGDGLEVGNVLAHYDDGWAPPRRIVDLYEEGDGVENLDVFSIGGEYDWIVSVSTIEHVREADNDWAASAALLYLRGLLAAGGRMMVTVGLGQNPTLDRFLDAAAHGTTFRRGRGVTDRQNTWTPTLAPVFVQPYGPTHGANAVWIGEWQA